MTDYVVHKTNYVKFPNDLYYHHPTDLLQMFNEVLAALEEETMTPEDLKKKLRWAWLRNLKWLGAAVGMLIVANGFAAGACYALTGKFFAAGLHIILGVELGTLGMASLVLAILLGIHQFVD